MEEKNEIQNSEFILKGGLGEVVIASSGVSGDIIQIVSNNQDGSVTITVSPHQTIEYVPNYISPKGFQFGEYQKFEEADFEIVEPKQLTDKE